MVAIDDSLRLLTHATLEKREDEYVLTVPKASGESGSIATDSRFRVAHLESTSDSRQFDPEPTETAPRETGSTDASRTEPHGAPVETGDVRTVTRATGSRKSNADSS